MLTLLCVCVFAYVRSVFRAAMIDFKHERLPRGVIAFGLVVFCYFTMWWPNSLGEYVLIKSNDADF